MSCAREEESLEIHTIGFPPYGIQGPEGYSGIYFDLGNALAQRAGLASHNYITPYARIKHDLKSGAADMTIMFKYPDLDEHVHYVAPLPTLRMIVIGLKGANLNSLEDLKGKKLAYLRGASFSAAIDADPSILIYRTINFKQGVKMLASQRVDAIIGPIDPILSAFAESGLPQDLLGEALVLSERTPWIQISKKSRFLNAIPALRQAYQEIVDEGLFEDLKGKHLVVSPAL
jgi:polar amino acid transport system substrate-binding protein